MVGWLVGALAWVGAPEAAGAGFLLVRADGQVQLVTLVEINQRTLVHGDPDRGWVSLGLQGCVALLNPEAAPAVRRQGMLRLGDGQRFPGEALSGAKPGDDMVAWNHATLGRLEVPLDRIESVAFTAGAVPLRPEGADVVLLANGDRVEGFVTALGDPVSIEIDDDGYGRTVEVPLERVAAISLVAPRKKPKGRRVWLSDGTVIDVAQVRLGDDGIVRLSGLPFATERGMPTVPLSSVAAILFDPQVFIPFAVLKPARVEGPATRYLVPPPRKLDELAALELSRLEFRGPLTVTYELPAGSTYFLAEARLAPPARSWGDCELVIRDDGQEVFRARLNRAQPTASISVPAKGPTLTIEITEGRNGPIHDHVILHRAMLLAEP